MKTTASVLCFLGICVLSACSQKKTNKLIIIKNTLDLERTFETVELSKSDLQLEDLSNVGVRDVDTKAFQVTQLVDVDYDGIMDVLLFQPKVAAKSEKTYEIATITAEEKPKSTDYCFSRFVPERTDDYAWENNRVAFRVFGPTAQKMNEAGDPAGTLSSGVDAWLKKVESPIINKWYEQAETGLSYHEDHGEGLDNFHVGVSRGVGAIAVKHDTAYYYSKNYSNWKTITTGPIRTSFYLKYETWNAGDKLIKESRIISLDYGSNLSKFVLSLEGSDEISVGLTLHEKDGEVSGTNENAWVSYWQPHGNSELGTAVVAPKASFKSFETYDTNAKDESNAYAHLKVKNNQVIYYTGFTWKESGQFKDKQAWETYLNEFSQKINEPLQVLVH
jgi:hypothetical protein